jgi:hypothetical protein
MGKRETLIHVQMLTEKEKAPLFEKFAGKNFLVRVPIIWFRIFKPLSFPRQKSCHRFSKAFVWAAQLRVSSISPEQRSILDPPRPVDRMHHIFKLYLQNEFEGLQRQVMRFDIQECAGEGKAEFKINIRAQSDSTVCNSLVWLRVIDDRSDESAQLFFDKSIAFFEDFVYASELILLLTMCLQIIRKVFHLDTGAQSFPVHTFSLLMD